MERIEDLNIEPARARPLLTSFVITAGAAILVFGFTLGDRRQFAFSYLTAALFALTPALGCLFFVLLHHVTGATWSVVVRKRAEDVTLAIPITAALLLPLGFVLRDLYPWAGAGAGSDAILRHRLPVMNAPAFLIRALICLAVWSLISWWFRRTQSTRLRAASAPALILFGVTVTVAAFDWIMSLDSHWSSSIFGVYIFAGSVVSGLALLGIVAILGSRGGSVVSLFGADQAHDLGKLLFGFLCFWAYIGFSQFLLVWYANMPEETAWYALRVQGGWRTLSLALAIGHFIVPFLFLLPREIKRRPSTLLLASLWILVMHYADLYWLIMPNLHRTAHPRTMDAMVLAGVVAITGGAVAHILRAS
jgi:hypothetical protein